MTVATKEKVKCPNCGKEGIKNLKMHEKYCIALHPELAPPAPEPELPVVVGEPEISPEQENIPIKLEIESVDNKEVRIGKILYSDIVKPLCEEHGIELRAWEEIDQSDFFKIAGKILSVAKD